uniref:NADH-ubiquinone oxidoreductase chain 5 n=1 Tax=Speleketor irwini TaxID=342007 RepID=A0A343QCI1_9NEOP|nr:NADH dehydrogenase subunit 5 [Speleketor irwini]ATU07128.1 NADH dehydrogenase subunit 5 [Speleketor irwini]
MKNSVLGSNCCMLISFSLFFFSFLMFMLGSNFIILCSSIYISWEIINLNSLSVEMSLLLDWMSLYFLGLVSLISGLVINYSGSYMAGEKSLFRFICLVFLFVMSMFFLIVSPNLISILLGWDGLGLVSYALVIYYQNVKSYNAGMVTALSNRIGDVMILISIGWMMNFGSWSFLYYLEWCMSGDYILVWVSFLIIVAGMTSSAQIPFSSWLPLAMAAPTPVSALVHSSTLVTAGVYLMIRFSYIFNSSIFSSFLFIVGSLTMFMAGLGANFEWDLKKIIALSTLSQLGLMMSTLGMGFVDLCFFHLLIHALFKAMLFMCAGYIIHVVKDNQDLRYMGGLGSHLPLLMVVFNIANMSLSGLPFLAGFYSKDLILEMCSMSMMNLVGYFLFYFSTGLTIMYSIRLFMMMIGGTVNLSGYHVVGDLDFLMMKNIVILGAFVLVGGNFMSWMLFSLPYCVELNFLYKVMSLIVIGLGGLMGYNLWSFSEMIFVNFYLNFKSYILFYFLGSMWFLPFISGYVVNNLVLCMGYYSIKLLDMGWSESIGGQGLFNVFVVSISSLFEKFQLNAYSLFLVVFIYMWILMIFYLI